MKHIAVAILWAALILAMATLTIIDMLPAESMAWILPMLSLGSVLHINALRRSQAAGPTGCGC